MAPRTVFILGVAAALLSGCGSGRSASSIPVTAAFTPSTRSGSWMLPETKGENLLYVSDGEGGAVYVYSYPMGKRVGTLTGFEGPTGECVDKRGDVWILNGSPLEVIEYAHGGTSPIATLSDPVAGWGCSIDPASGDLAVAGGGHPAEVAIYKHAKGTPTIYSDPKVPLNYDACTYDDHGNLFIVASGGYHTLAELPKGGNSIFGIAFPPLSFGNIQWDGHELAISQFGGGQGPTRIFRVQVVGASARIVGSTYLYANRDKNQPGVQFWIAGDRIVMPTPARGASDSILSVWSYPWGGDPINRIRAWHAYFLDGVAVSPKV